MAAEELGLTEGPGSEEAGPGDIPVEEANAPVAVNAGVGRPSMAGPLRVVRDG
jgi:thiazole synthase ThiGH ThiG subunit